MTLGNSHKILSAAISLYAIGAFTALDAGVRKTTGSMMSEHSGHMNRKMN